MHYKYLLHIGFARRDRNYLVLKLAMVFSEASDSEWRVIKCIPWFGVYPLRLATRSRKSKAE